MSRCSLPEDLHMRHDVPGEDSMLDLNKTWRRLWLSQIFVLAAMIGLGLTFTALLNSLNSFSETHCYHATNEPTMPRQAGLL
jgi:hypothetical protein